MGQTLAEKIISKHADKPVKAGELVIAKAACHYQFDLSPIDGTKVGQYDGHDDIYLNLDNELSKYEKMFFKQYKKENLCHLFHCHLCVGYAYAAGVCKDFFQ